MSRQQINELKIKLPALIQRTKDLLAWVGADWDLKGNQLSDWWQRAVRNGETEDMKNLIGTLDGHRQIINDYVAWRAKGTNTDTVVAVVVFLESRMSQFANLTQESINNMEFTKSSRKYRIGEMRSNPELSIKYLDMEIGTRHLRQMLGTTEFSKKFVDALKGAKAARKDAVQKSMAAPPPKEPQYPPGFHPDFGQQPPQQPPQQPQQPVSEGVVGSAVALQVATAMASATIRLLLKWRKRRTGESLWAAIKRIAIRKKAAATVAEAVDTDDLVATAMSVIQLSNGSKEEFAEELEKFAQALISLINEKGDNLSTEHISQLLSQFPSVRKLMDGLNLTSPAPFEKKRRIKSPTQPWKKD